MRHAQVLPASDPESIRLAAEIIRGGGLVSIPVIAVPTSVGYGAAFGGLTALACMLTSCASGITVCNIDNGFGAAFAAARILRTVARY